MHLNAEIKSVCSQFFEDLQTIADEQNRVHITILYFIHTAAHLSKLYLKWTDLHPEEKFSLNMQMNRSLTANTKAIYPPVIRAFEYWDKLQDHGAPGFSGNPIKEKINRDLDKGIGEMLLIMEKVINQIDLKRKLAEELSAYEDPSNILYDYQCRIICRKLNRKKNSSRQKRSKLSKSGEISDEGNSSDINGSGDITWFTL